LDFLDFLAAFFLGAAFFTFLASFLAAFFFGAAFLAAFFTGFLTAFFLGAAFFAGIIGSALGIAGDIDGVGVGGIDGNMGFAGSGSGQVVLGIVFGSCCKSRDIVEPPEFLI
jgi:hypothetical protein